MGIGIWVIDFGEFGYLFVLFLFDLVFVDFFFFLKLMSILKLRLNCIWSCYSVWGVGIDKMLQVIGVDFSLI